DLRVGLKLARGLLEWLTFAGVDDEAPAALGERAGERQAEAARSAGDDRGRHGPDGRRRAPAPPSGIGLRTPPTRGAPPTARPACGRSRRAWPARGRRGS